MLNERLAARRLPVLLPRDEMLSVLQTEIFGTLPERPTALTFTAQEKIVPKFCAGKADIHRVTAHCVVRGKEFSFPFSAVLPTDGKRHPFFIHINFRDAVPDRYMPTEELVDNGFAVLSFCYADVTEDGGDFTDGLAGVLFENGKRRPTDPGKIALWAWAAQRVLDWAETRADVLDLDRAVVCGHSRLGKTALVAAATDERFRFAYSNDSGCAGAALARGTHGETVADICERFPFWFCENYLQYADNESAMPFDQHFLLACIAPRFVCVGSASEDAWADPISEQLCCLAASPAFANGFVCPDRPAETGEQFFDGDVGYHLRRGQHYFSREDWQRLIGFVEMKSEFTKQQPLVIPRSEATWGSPVDAKKSRRMQ